MKFGSDLPKILQEIEYRLLDLATSLGNFISRLHISVLKIS